MRSLALHEQALAIDQRLAGQDQDNPTRQRDVSVSLGRLADLKAAAGDRAGALALHEQALAIDQRLAGQDQDNPDRQIVLSYTLLRVGCFALAEAQVEKARLSFQESTAIVRTMAARHPDVPDYRVRLVARNFQNAMTDALTVGGPSIEADAMELFRGYLRLDAISTEDNLAARADVIGRMFCLRLIPGRDRAMLEADLAVVRELDAAGKVTALQRQWIALLEAALSAKPAVTTPPKPRRSLIARLFGSGT